MYLAANSIRTGQLLQILYCTRAGDANDLSFTFFNSPFSNESCTVSVQCLVTCVGHASSGSMPSDFECLLASYRCSPETFVHRVHGLFRNSSALLSI